MKLNYIILAIAYVAELLIAELIFLYPFARKKWFALRYTLSVLVCGAAHLFLYLVLRPHTVGALETLVGSLWAPSVYNLFHYSLILCLSAIGMMTCFTAPISWIISACCGGYALQHIAHKLCDLLYVYAPLGDWLKASPVRNMLSEPVCCALIYPLGWFIFALPAKKCYGKSNGDPVLNLLSASIVAVCIGLNRFSRDFTPRVDTQIISSSCYAITCCVFALIIQFLLLKRSADQTEMELQSYMRKEQARQYEEWRANVEGLGIMYHDLRHELNTLKQAQQNTVPVQSLEKLENLLNDHLSLVKTDSDLLNVLLTTKYRFCEQRDIIFTCITDGTALAGINEVELVSLLCNAIDNAIEGAGTVAEQEKKVINLEIKKMGNFASIHLQNYFEGALQFHDGLPLSTAAGSGHGYGMRSMRRTVEQLGGVMEVFEENGLFHLQILLPSKAEQTT